MILSERITQLQNLLATHGDVKVVHYGNDGYQNMLPTYVLKEFDGYYVSEYEYNRYVKGNETRQIQIDQFMADWDDPICVEYTRVLFNNNKDAYIKHHMVSILGRDEIIKNYQLMPTVLEL